MNTERIMALRKIGAVTDLKITGDNPRPIDKGRPAP